MDEAAVAPPELRKATLSALRESLGRAGYTQRNIAAAVGRRAPFPDVAREVYSRRLSEGPPLSTLIRLFYLGGTVSEGDATRALGAAVLKPLIETAVLELAAGAVTPRLALTPFAGLYLLHDRDDREDLAAWHVSGVAPASKSLAGLTVRRSVDSALDVGTGCGVQALLAARHAGRVVAVDLNPRALQFARLNAVLNDIDNVELREGDLFDPVEGQRFDLIVANPPFVISPASELLFRDAGLAGDELSRLVLASAATFLADNGYASVLCSWIAPSAESWSRPILEWLEGCGCDFWVLRFTLDDPIGYAAKWTRDFDRWLAYYRDTEIEQIALGATVLRRPGTTKAAVAATSAPRGRAGPQIERIFAAQRELAAGRGTAESLLATRFRLIEGHRLEQTAAFRGGKYAVVGTKLTMVEGVGVDPVVETDAVHVLARLRPDVTLADAIDRATRETGLERSLVEHAAVTTLRRLYTFGFAERVDEENQTGDALSSTASSPGST